MSPAEQGFVFSMLLKHRELSTRPIGRSAFPEEIRTARILYDCGQTVLDDFDEFLSGQGLGLRILDGIADLAIPDQSGRPIVYYILCRRFGEEAPSYVDVRAFFSDFRDRRRERSADDEAVELNKTSSVFWIARLWLTLQYFFYDRIDRPVGNLYNWRNAMVKETDFITQLKTDVETMGNAGRPEGEAGLLWDDYWQKRESIPQIARRFFKLMKQYRMIEPTDQEGIWRQTLVAAVDMSGIADRSLRYLMPATDQALLLRSQSLINGYEEFSIGEEDAPDSRI
jgi:hypothetical protein